LCLETMRKIFLQIFYDCLRANAEGESSGYVDGSMLLFDSDRRKAFFRFCLLVSSGASTCCVSARPMSDEGGEETTTERIFFLFSSRCSPVRCMHEWADAAICSMRAASSSLDPYAEAAHPGPLSFFLNLDAALALPFGRSSSS